MNDRLHPLSPSPQSLGPQSLGPMTLGEILDRTAQMYRRGFLRYWGIAFVPTAVLLVFVALTVGFSAWMAHAQRAGTSGNALGILIFVYIGVMAVVALPVFASSVALSWAAITDAAAKTFLGGTFTIREAYGSVWKWRWRVLWLLTMEALFLGVIPGSAGFAVMMLNVELTGKGGIGLPSAVVAVGTFVLIAALAGGALWLLLRLCLGFAACVMEQVSAWQALKRSWALSKGTKGRLFVVFLLGYSLEMLLTIGFFLLVVIVISLVPSLQGAKNANAVSTVTVFAFYGLSFLVKSLTRPVYGIALTLAYFDQRIRKEGFDIEWMMQHAGMAGLAATGEQHAAQAAASPWLVLPEEPTGGSES